MISQTLVHALNEQLTMERQNAAIYDALAAGLELVHWPGSMKFMRASAGEEREHAEKICSYLIDRSWPPYFGVLSECTVIINDDLRLYYQAALEREQATTEALKELHYLAEQEEDPQTCTFLIWFLDEQTKSESELADILQMLARLDNNGRVVWDGQI